MRGESRAGSDRTEGWRMTGSALQAVDVVCRLLLGENLLEMGGGPGGGVQKIGPGGRDADFFSVCFLGLFFGGFFFKFLLSFGQFLGVPGGHF